MQKAIEKAHTLIEAMSYIRRFRDRIVVIKMGGSVMNDQQTLDDMLADVAFMSTVGMRVVIVHGGGTAISEAMEQRGLEVQFVRGRRYTDRRTLTVVEQVLCNQINKHIVEVFRDHGLSAEGLHTLSSCVLTGEKLFLEEDGRKIDLGLVGHVVDVNRSMIDALCRDNTIPVIAPLALSKSGVKFNCNADTAVGEVAAVLKAAKLVFVTDTHGIRRDPDDPESVVSTATKDEIDAMIASGVIDGGMVPKVEACLKALDAGVSRTHIIDGRFNHSLLLEIFSDRGVGTLIQK